MCELIQTQREAILRAALQAGISRPIAELIAAEVERSIRLVYGGDTLYIGMPSKTERNLQIRESHRRGATIAVLSSRFGLSSSRIRQIIAYDHD